MAVSSSSLSAIFPISNSSNTLSTKPRLSLHSLPLHRPKLESLLAKTSSPSLASKVSAAPEVLDTEEAATSFKDESPEIVGADSNSVAPKQKIRIKLRSYWVPLIEDSCKQILDAAKNTNAKTMGPVPLPTKKRIYCVLKSPHVHKDARFHFEIRTHQRLIDILYPTAQTIDSLMQLDLPAGVDVEVKL
ncbi:OLC1v1022527C1 [Oldenlandia corymbosa var. corymbosa]|uniref:Small ribosomal subunit protein uS10c n=1 Tax=Oldenlandia corymbosa var. corymbosa TaxID=529605 RepID=A0AAV1C1R2_OLDCO|nr:OLC1v1022527C1 [Oldenlandia corymbosa var. corymbosa]